MRVKPASMALSLLLAASGGSACAMNSPTRVSVQCSVKGVEKLPSELGGTAGICNALAAAIGPKQGARVATVQVTVFNAYRTSAVVTMADGRVLPEQNLAIADSKLNQRSIAMLARAIAAQIAATP